MKPTLFILQAYINAPYALRITLFISVHIDLDPVYRPYCPWAAGLPLTLVDAGLPPQLQNLDCA